MEIRQGVSFMTQQTCITFCCCQFIHRTNVRMYRYLYNGLYISSRLLHCFFSLGFVINFNQLYKSSPILTFRSLGHSKLHIPHPEYMCTFTIMQAGLAAVCHIEIIATLCLQLGCVLCIGYLSTHSNCVR